MILKSRLFIIIRNLIKEVLNQFIFTVAVNKQINDKERIAAAMENPNLRNLVENCIADEE